MTPTPRTEAPEAAFVHRFLQEGFTREVSHGQGEADLPVEA
jgi:hypothetical protein